MIGIQQLACQATINGCRRSVRRIHRRRSPANLGREIYIAARLSALRQMRSLRLVDPGHLDGLQDLFVRSLRIVRKLGECSDTAVQVRESDPKEIDLTLCVE